MMLLCYDITIDVRPHTQVVIPLLGETETPRVVGTHLQTVTAIRLSVNNIKDVFVDFFPLRDIIKKKKTNDHATKYILFDFGLMG